MGKLGYQMKPYIYTNGTAWGSKGLGKQTLCEVGREGEGRREYLGAGTKSIWARKGEWQGQVRIVEEKIKSNNRDSILIFIYWMEYKEKMWNGRKENFREMKEGKWMKELKMGQRPGWRSEWMEGYGLIAFLSLKPSKQILDFLFFNCNSE